MSDAAGVELLRELRGDKIGESAPGLQVAVCMGDLSKNPSDYQVVWGKEPWANQDVIMLHRLIDVAFDEQRIVQTLTPEELVKYREMKANGRT